MRRICAFLLLIFLISCNQGEPGALPSSNLSIKPSKLLPLSGTPEYLTKVEQLQTIGSSMYSFVTVNDWYDNETLLYLTDENGLSKINKFHVFTGAEEDFFQIDQPIIHVKANTDRSVFMVEVATMKGNIEIFFVGVAGEVLYKLDVGDYYEVYWNPFADYEVTIATMQDDFSVQVFHVDLNKKTVIDFELDHYYVQWVAKDELAFLKWDTYSLSFYAPLFLFDMKEQQKTKLLDNIISFFSFETMFFTVSIENKDVTHSDYNFYHSESKELLSTLQMPILNTYSEQWWIPFHDYDSNSNTFYVLQPLNYGDLFDYSEGFMLISYQVGTEKTREIIALDQNYPIKVSPDGRWLLYGYQLENVVDLHKKKTHSILHW